MSDESLLPQPTPPTSGSDETRQMSVSGDLQSAPSTPVVPPFAQANAAPPESEIVGDPIDPAAYLTSADSAEPHELAVATRPVAEPDPLTAKGPPWPRLVATDPGFVPPRLPRWPVPLGILLLVASIGLGVLWVNATRLPSSAPPYSFTASDAHFTATFPGKPHRREETTEGITFIQYHADLADHAITVGYAALSAGSSLDLDAGVRAGAASAKATLVSHASLTYHDQPAADGVLATSTEVGKIRIVVFGTSFYVLGGEGRSNSAFTSDYQRLLDTFSSTAEPARTTPSSSPLTATIVPPTPTPSATRVRPEELAAKLVEPPAGYVISQDPQAKTGPVSAAGFDVDYGKGTAADLHYAAGYQIFYDSVEGTEGVAIYLYSFGTPDDATDFASGVSQGYENAKFKATPFPAIPGAKIHEGPVPGSPGVFDHVVVASKNHIVMLVEYLNDAAARPLTLERVARQQHTRL
jgi:hypothetical protein